jgi:Protein of unknown function (DUF2786)
MKRKDTLVDKLLRMARSTNNENEAKIAQLKLHKMGFDWRAHEPKPEYEDDKKDFSFKWKFDGDSFDKYYDDILKREKERLFELRMLFCAGTQMTMNY